LHGAAAVAFSRLFFATHLGSRKDTHAPPVNAAAAAAAAAANVSQQRPRVSRAGLPPVVEGDESLKEE
jgi:hypothetical protein